MEKILISACLVIRNEEEKLPQCLESFKDVVDEIIIVHDGLCQDKSIEIARYYADKIFIREQRGMCELHRAFSFSQARGEWILIIDADEFLSEKLKNKLSDLTQNKDVDAYSFSFSSTDKPCLFRKNKMFFTGIPHFLIETRGRLVKSDLILEHQPKSFSLDLFKKNNRWAKIHAETLLKNFNELESFQARREDVFSLKRRIYITFPLISAFPKAIKAVFCDIFFNHVFEKGFKHGFQSVIIQFFYNFLLCLHLFNLKIKKFFLNKKF